MKIKRFKLRDGVTRDELVSLGFREGGSWILGAEGEKADLFKTFGLDNNVSVNIVFKKTIDEWDDFTNILVLDEMVCQPYTPFYDNYGKDIKVRFKALVSIVTKYNELMSSLSFLVEV